MIAPDAVWGSLFAVGCAYEAYGIAVEAHKPGNTLSETFRRWFRVKTHYGRWTFRVMWLGFAVWFLFHIAGNKP